MRTPKRRGRTKATGGEFALLERRVLMCAGDASHKDAHGRALGTFPAVEALPQDPVPLVLTSDVQGTFSSFASILSGIPQLHSNQSASKRLYLDFDGSSSMNWGSY